MWSDVYYKITTCTAYSGDVKNKFNGRLTKKMCKIIFGCTQ